MSETPPEGGRGAQYSADEKREAFAAWDRYKEQLDQAIRDMVPNVPVRGQNPMFPIIFADGYLRGKAAQAARLAAQKPVVDAVLKLSTYSRETVDAGVRRIMQALGEYEDWLLEHPNV